MVAPHEAGRAGLSPEETREVARNYHTSSYKKTDAYLELLGLTEYFDEGSVPETIDRATGEETYR